METMIHVLQCIRDACRESLSSLSLPEQEYSGKELEQARLLSEQLKQARLELLSATEQYVHDLSAHPEQKELLSECHEKLQEQIFRRIQSLQEQLKPQVEPKQQGQLKPLPPSKRMETPELSAVQANAPTCRPVSLLEILDQLLERKELLREEAELLVERIEVDELGMPRIRLRFCIGPAAVPILSRTLNQQEGQLLSVIRELSGGILPPPSPSALSRKLSQAGYPITKAGVLPYLRLFNEAVPNLHCSSSNRRDAPDGL